jgi:hypothetical protein
MNAKPKSKGPWISRFAVRFFSVVFAVLIFWLLGFIMDDIKTIRGPRYEPIEEKHIDKALVEKTALLERQIEEFGRKIRGKREDQRMIGDSSRHLQRTMNQLLELQKVSIQKKVPLSETEKQNFTRSLNLFLEHQKKYQEMNQTISDLVAKKRDLQEEKRNLEEKIEEQREPARVEYEKLGRRHELKLASIQLAILIPLLAIAAVVILKKRSSLYFPLLAAFGAATLIKAGLVIHEYFPSRYFKYILITALILAVVKLLIYLIRTVAFPKAQWLTKQYREAYERFLCPVCEYPIRIGPRRFLFWTRRTVNKIVVPGEKAGQEEPYTCPSCGTALFSECPSCHKIRHALLPHCAHCGAEKSLE